MPFNFSRLWSLLATNNMSKEELRNKIGASQTTIVNLGKNKNVSLDVIDRICEILHCEPEDIFEFIPHTPVIQQEQLTLNKGDIYTANIISDRNDAIQSGVRPVVIYQSNASLKFSKNISVFPVTSRLPKHDKLNVVDMPIIENNYYLQNRSVIEPFRLITISNNNLIDKIGTLPDNILNQLDQYICNLFDIKFNL